MVQSGFEPKKRLEIHHCSRNLNKIIFPKYFGELQLNKRAENIFLTEFGDDNLQYHKTFMSKTLLKDKTQQEVYWRISIKIFANQNFITKIFV